MLVTIISLLHVVMHVPHFTPDMANNYVPIKSKIK